MILNPADDDGCESVKGLGEHSSSMSEILLIGTKRMIPDTNGVTSDKCLAKHSPGSSSTLEKCMSSSTRVEVNGTESAALPQTLHVIGSDFVNKDDDSPVPMAIDKSIIIAKSASVPGESNGTESDALPQLDTVFVYNDDDSPAPLTIDESISTPESASQNRSLPGESNVIESDAWPQTLHVLGSDFAHNDDASPAPLTIDESITNPISASQNGSIPGHSNGTESEAVPLTLHEPDRDFVYNAVDSPVPLTIDESIITPDRSVPEERNDTESDAVHLTSHVLVSDFVNNNDDSPAPLTTDEPIITPNSASQNGSVSGERRERRRSSRLSSNASILGTPDCQHSSENKAFGGKRLRTIPSRSASVQRGYGSSEKLALSASSSVKTEKDLILSGETPRLPGLELHVCKTGHIEVKSASNKKQRKLKIASFFVGEPVPEDEAREKWGWRYELKGLRREGQRSIRNVGKDDEVQLNVACHYTQANVDGCIFNLGDCAHIKG